LKNVCTPLECPFPLLFLQDLETVSDNRLHVLQFTTRLEHSPLCEIRRNVCDAGRSYFGWHKLTSFQQKQTSTTARA
jgi:hypothetical protein